MFPLSLSLSLYKPANALLQIVLGCPKFFFLSSPPIPFSSQPVLWSLSNLHHHHPNLICQSPGSFLSVFNLACLLIIWKLFSLADPVASSIPSLSYFPLYNEGCSDFSVKMSLPLQHAFYILVGNAKFLFYSCAAWRTVPLSWLNTWTATTATPNPQKQSIMKTTNPNKTLTHCLKLFWQNVFKSWAVRFIMCNKPNILPGHRSLVCTK